MTDDNALAPPPTTADIKAVINQFLSERLKAKWEDIDKEIGKTTDEIKLQKLIGKRSCYQLHFHPKFGSRMPPNG